MKVLVFGGSGLVGSRFVKLSSQTFEIKSPSAEEVDILNRDQVAKICEEFDPDTIINFAAYTQVENAEAQKGDKNGICYLINAIGAKNVAEVCRQYNKHLIHISTEYIFDGTKTDSPYKETDRPNPINWYGATKFYGEDFVLKSGCLSTVVRISMPYSSYYGEKKDIARFFLENLKAANTIKAIGDQKITPTLIDDIVRALKVLINIKSSGIYHVCVNGYTSPYEFAKLLAHDFHLDHSPIVAIPFEEYTKNKQAKILKYSWLNPAKFIKEFGEGILHTIEENVQEFKQAVDGYSLN